MAESGGFEETLQLLAHVNSKFIVDANAEVFPRVGANLDRRLTGRFPLLVY